MELIFLPLGRFAFGILSFAWRRHPRVFGVASFLTDAVLLVRLAIRLAGGTPLTITLGGWDAGIGISLSGDRIGLTFAALAWGVAVAVFLYQWRDRLRPYYFMLFHLLIGACYALSFTTDLFNAYLVFELLTLVSFLLVGYPRQPQQIWASLRYLFLCSIGMSLFLVGIGVTYTHTGSLRLAEIARCVTDLSGAPWIPLAAALLVAGVAVKAGVFIFSLWLPDAHARAMPAVSALLSGLVIKMGVVELFRLADVFPLHMPLLVLGVVTAVLGIIYALQTYDVKRLLAFHTLSQIGYLLIGFAAGTTVGRLGALDYAVAHGLFKSLLFLAIGDACTRLGTTRVPTLAEHRHDIARGTKAAILVGMLGIVGLPPLAGFAAKAALESGLSSVLVHAMVAVVSVGTAASFAKLLPLVARGGSGVVPWSRAAAYLWLAAAIVLFEPLSRAMVPYSAWLTALRWPAVLEAVLAVAAGVAAYQALRRRRWALPQAVFRLEEGPLVILAGFLLVFLLIATS
jgi:multicomponent Na+:H+ antiporter subunit D